MKDLDTKFEQSSDTQANVMLRVTKADRPSFKTGADFVFALAACAHFKEGEFAQQYCVGQCIAIAFMLTGKPAVNGQSRKTKSSFVYVDAHYMVSVLVCQQATEHRPERRAKSAEH
eukprot:scaffold11996_cov22-Tisochrysis_lutea.AAC.2